MSDPADGAQDEDNPRTVLMHEVDPALAAEPLPPDETDPPPSDSAVKETTAATEPPVSDLPPPTEPPPAEMLTTANLEELARTVTMQESAEPAMLPARDEGDGVDNPLVPDDQPISKPLSSKTPVSKEPLAAIKATYRIDRVVVRVPGGDAEEDDEFNPRTVPIHEISAEAIERARAAARRALAEQDDDDNPRTLNFEAPKEPGLENSEDKTTNWDRSALMTDLAEKVGDDPQRLSPTDALEIPGLNAPVGHPDPPPSQPLVQRSADATWPRVPVGASRPPPDLSHVNLVRMLLIGVVVLVVLLVAIGIMMARR